MSNVIFFPVDCASGSPSTTSESPDLCVEIAAGQMEAQRTSVMKHDHEGTRWNEEFVMYVWTYFLLLDD
jgi:hypothetical protein